MGRLAKFSDGPASIGHGFGNEGHSVHALHFVTNKNSERHLKQNTDSGLGTGTAETVERSILTEGLGQHKSLLSSPH